MAWGRSSKFTPGPINLKIGTWSHCFLKYTTLESDGVIYVLIPGQHDMSRQLAQVIKDRLENKQEGEGGATCKQSV